MNYRHVYPSVCAKGKSRAGFDSLELIDLMVKDY